MKKIITWTQWNVPDIIIQMHEYVSNDYVILISGIHGGGGYRKWKGKLYESASDFYRGF